MNRKPLIALLLLFLSTGLRAQEEWTVLQGRVTCSGRPVPYATLQLAGTSVGVACNDDGEYLFKVPAGHEADTVVVRSVGFEPVRRTVASLREKGDVRMRSHDVQLREVRVESFRSARHLVEAAVERIDSNYSRHTAWSTFFYRDWRALDDELYLFDEAVMSIRRAPYAKYGDKRAYRFAADRREMETNYKTLLRHRLLVYDRALLSARVDDPEGVDDLLAYADNEEFYDPVAAPQASFALSRGSLSQHTFEPIREFVSDDEVYYLVRSVGPGRLVKAKVHFEYTIRKSDLAIVALTAVQDSLCVPPPIATWVNFEFSHMAVAADSTVWRYDVHDGRYTLSRYYNNWRAVLAVGDRWHFIPKQRWQRCVDWTLTDYSAIDPGVQGELLDVRPKDLAVSFGRSDFAADFWGRYNSVPVDASTLRLLVDKLEGAQKDNK